VVERPDAVGQLRVLGERQRMVGSASAYQECTRRRAEDGQKSRSHVMQPIPFDGLT
jgi:hypothetical protein